MKVNSLITPLLLIGDKGNISNEMIKRGDEETRRVRGVITFSDGSKLEGTREMIFGDPILRVGDTEVEGMFLPTEYYG